MFYKTSKEAQLNLFSDTHTFLSGAALKVYENNKNWHNLFREQITFRIDEELFRPLFCCDNGAPNASIRILIAMMILKEARGLSDCDLFENCRFNLLYRSALGLPNMDDSLPAISTYYLLRQRIVNWEKEGNENLIEKVFAQVTQSQAIEFKINGKAIRMDSKLLGSNIAWNSRYELIHECLRRAYYFVKAKVSNLVLSESDIKLLEDLCKESGEKVSYRSNREQIESKLKEMGKVIYKFTQQLDENSSEALSILFRVFDEQYIVDDEVVTPRSKENIQVGSVQSPHDPQCHYRNKDGNQVKGYSINLAETCDTDASLNLITSVLVDVASAADNDFLQPAIEATQQVIVGEIETVNADGAYHSVDNQSYCKEKDIDLILSAIQGKPSRYDLSYNDKGELIVTDLDTNTIIPCYKVKSRKADTLKWTIKDTSGNRRYFTQKEIDTCLLRKQIADRTPAEKNLRNNVEATIFQLGYPYPNDKSRYRGLIKHKIWANLRCLWINFVRIVKFIVSSGENYAQKVKNQLLLYKILTNSIKTVCLILLIENFCPPFQKVRVKKRSGENRFL
jgi:hypothetical protein